MNQEPDWIKGGYPVQTSWRGKQDQLGSLGLEWESMGYWEQVGDTLEVAAGRTRDGKTVALRVSCRLRNTSRKIYSEFGWCLEPNASEVLPIISPSVWQKAWLAHLEGEINEQRLVERVLCETSSEQLPTMAFKLPVDKGNAPRSRPLVPFILGMFIVGVGLGIGIGKYLQNSAYSTLEKESQDLKTQIQDIEQQLERIPVLEQELERIRTEVKLDPEKNITPASDATINSQP